MKKSTTILLAIGAAFAGGYVAAKLYNKSKFGKSLDIEDALDDALAQNKDGIVAIDGDGDGNVDTVMLDTDGDGTIDTILLDTTGDGDLDTVLADTDGDGTFESVISDGLN